MNIDSFIVYIETDGIYKVIAEDVETRFDTVNYELDRLLDKGKKINCINEKWIRCKNHDKVCWAKSKIYGYLIDDGNEDK